MQPINIIRVYYWDKKLKKKKIHVLEADIMIIEKKKNIDHLSFAQRIHFLQDLFQMTAIALFSVINHYDIYGLHLFCDTLYYIRIPETIVHSANYVY